MFVKSLTHEISFKRVEVLRKSRLVFIKHVCKNIFRFHISAFRSMICVCVLYNEKCRVEMETRRAEWRPSGPDLAPASTISEGGLSERGSWQLGAGDTDC